MTDQDPLLDWLYSLQGPALKWDLETARAFCATLGDPQLAFPAVHIAGTNGKGSVAAFLHQHALASGLRSGLCTSPHLVHPEERIRLGAEDIARPRFRALIEKLGVVAARALDEGTLPRHPSFFEILTAAAFVAFREDGLELGVVETGLGGRLDATNVLQPKLAVITTIGLDHVKTLGGSLASIAREKAGIVKPGVPVLVGWIEAGPLAEIEAAAARCGAPLHRAADELVIEPAEDGSFDVVTPERRYRGLRPALRGAHQRANAALALRAAELLRAAGVALDPERAGEALATARWPGRCERIERAGVAYLLDGAHNLDGADALAATLAEERDALRARHLGTALGGIADDDRNNAATPRVLVFGITEGREAAALLRPLRPFVTEVVVARPAIEKGIDAATVAGDLRRAFPDLATTSCSTLEEALSLAEARVAAAPPTSDGPRGVLVAGSLYLVGDARRHLLGLTFSGHPEHETRVAAAIPPRPPGRRPDPAPNTIPDLPIARLRNDATVAVTLEDAETRLDLAALFGNTREVEFEVGVGKGRFLLLAATARPDVNFLGVEYARRYAEQAIERVAKRALGNVRIACCNVHPVLEHRLPDAALAAVHVYFPDPWPKSRHHKRRFFQPATLAHVARVLRPGGLLRAATDHPEYAAWIRTVMDGIPEFVDAGPAKALWELPGMGDYTAVGVTNFEIKYRREGRPIHRFAWYRR